MSENKVIYDNRFEGTNLEYRFEIDGEEYGLFVRAGVFQLEKQDSWLDLNVPASKGIDWVVEHIIEIYKCKKYKVVEGDNDDL